MAASIVFTGENPVMGNKRMAIGYVTLTDQASGAVDTGLGYIAGGVTSIRSGTADVSHAVSFNVASGSTATNGWLQIRSAVSGDVIDVFLWGS